MYKESFLIRQRMKIFSQVNDLYSEVEEQKGSDYETAWNTLGGKTQIN